MPRYIVNFVLHAGGTIDVQAETPEAAVAYVTGLSSMELESHLNGGVSELDEDSVSVDGTFEEA